VARIAGEHIDNITLHHYAQADEDASRDDQYWLAVTAPSRIGDLIAMSRATIDAHAPGGKRIPISFDEWNVIHRHAKYPRVIANGDWSALEHQALFTTLGEQMGVAHQDYALVDGLYAALFFNVLLRNADHVTMANQAQLVNLFGLIETGPAGAYGTAEYHAFRLYVEQSGPTAVAVRVDSPTFEVRATGNLPARQGEPYLDVAATQDIERRKLWLHVVNRHPREEIAVRIDVGAGITEAVHHLLGGRGPWTRNSFTDPEAIAVSSTHLDWVGAGPLTFPACSASSLELTLAEP
ncbi:MAG: alpha-L-arabinofuranosidase C-terminal domain-containing protein, partial [Chloroflexota bacterium]